MNECLLLLISLDHFYFHIRHLNRHVNILHAALPVFQTPSYQGHLSVDVSDAAGAITVAASEKSAKLISYHSGGFALSSQFKYGESAYSLFVSENLTGLAVAFEGAYETACQGGVDCW
jgi:hypothetical protein